MANLNVYDSNTGLTKSITVDIGSSIINGTGTGTSEYYIVVSTGVKDPEGHTIEKIYISGGDITNDLSSVIQAAVVELFKHMAGEYVSSSSSSSEVWREESTESTQHGMTSSTSISSSRLEGTSSSLSSSSSSSSTVL
jgi:hypothetical protein